MACPFNRPDRDAKKYVHLLPKLYVPSPSQRDDRSQALQGTFSFRRSFCPSRRLPQNTLPSHPKPRQMHKGKPTAQCLPSSQIGVHMHTCPRTSLFFYVREHNSLKCSVSCFLSGLGFTKMATGVGPGDENLLSYTQWSLHSVLPTFVS